MTDTSLITELDDEVLSGRPINWPDEGEMHFRLVDSMLGEIDLSCTTGYIIRSYEFGFPEVREVVYPLTLDDGTLDYSAFVGARSVSLDIVLRNTPDVDALQAPTWSEAEMRDNLLRFCSPGVRPVMLFSEQGDSRVRMLTLRGSDAPISVSQPRFNTFSVSWRAPTGLIENVDQHRAYVTFEDVLDAEYIIHTNNRGSVPAHWQLTIRGDIESPHIFIGNRHLWLNYHLEPPSIVVIDSRTKTVRLNNQPVGYRYLDDKSDWFRIPPGEQSIHISHQAVPRFGLPYAVWQPDNSQTSRESTAWASLTSQDVTTTHLPTAATYPNLASLKADPTNGDGDYHGPPFTPGDYVRLGDTSQAWYDSDDLIWITGYMPYNNPSPVGAPPWVWSPSIDETTGEPVTGEMLFTYRETYL